MVNIIALPIMIIGVIIIFLAIRKGKKAVVIEEYELSELSKIWVDVQPKEEVVEVVKVVKEVEVERVNYDENTGEIFESEPDLLSKFINELMKQINMIDDSGRCGVFTLFDTDNVFISQKSLSIIAEKLAVAEDEIISELQLEGYTSGSYKLYKVYFNNNKQLVYKNLNIKLFCTDDIEKRKGKNFTIKNIEEVKSA